MSSQKLTLLRPWGDTLYSMLLPTNEETLPRQRMKHSLTLPANKRFLLFNEQLV